MPENKNSTDLRKRAFTQKGTVVSDKMNKTIVVRIDTATRYRLRSAPVVLLRLRSS